MNASVRTTEIVQEKRMRIHAVLWNVLGGGSISYALTELFESLPAPLVERRLWCLREYSNHDFRRDYHSPVMPPLAYRCMCKLGIPGLMQGRLTSRVPLRSIRPGDIVYVWPDFDLNFIKSARNRGAIVVAERSNTMAAMAREALAKAYDRRGLPLPTGWFDPSAMEREAEQMRSCDFVIARNAFVSQSLRDAGIPQHRIIEDAYGYSPVRLSEAIGLSRPPRRPVFAFVGEGIIGKGLDVLLEAWTKAAIDGKLLIAGQIKEEVSGPYKEALKLPNVSALGFISNVASVYSAADVFIFPSHTEGGPQVVYEAAGCGLPSIVSPMGAGRIVRDGREGLLIDPLNVEALAGAIVRMAEDERMRRRMGTAAAKRAREFTWAKAGERLYNQFKGLTI